jgi:hypothetical protein
VRTTKWRADAPIQNERNVIKLKLHRCVCFDQLARRGHPAASDRDSFDEVGNRDRCVTGDNDIGCGA